LTAPGWTLNFAHGAGENLPMELITTVLWLRARQWIGYAAALSGCAAGLFLDLHFHAILASTTFLVFFPGIFIASLAAGARAGALAAILAAAAAAYYLIPPLHSLAVTWPRGVVEVSLFLAINAVLITLIDFSVATSMNLARTTAQLRENNTGLVSAAQERAAALQVKEALIRTFFEHSSQCHVVFVIDAEGQFRYEEINPATLKLYGRTRDEVIGRRLEDVFDAVTAAILNAHLARCLRDNEPVQYERVQGDSVIEALATPVPGEDGAAPSRVIVTAGDVTRRRALEQQLRQSQKMEAVGQLTGGLAHDFNNLLTGITGSIELTEIRLAEGRLEQLPRYLQTAKSAAKRAAALTHRLLAFSRRQTLDPKPTDINRLIADLDDLIRRTVGPAITVEFIGAAGLWPTLIDQNQLENAVLNLAINARDAMPEGGRLTIETGNKWLDERAARERDLTPGQYVSLCVSDTGCGMIPAVAARAFDPFFTTKPLGAGTGLGLSMVYGFARQSGGQARIYSEPGAGTMVCLYLPRHFGETAQPDAPEAATIAPAANGETVLVVDDEPSVRMLVTEVLGELGFTSIEAEDGKAALKILESPRRVDLLITDVGLPGGLNGRQLAQAGIQVRPDLKILFITGYAENAVVGDGHLERGTPILTKPFAMADLARRVREIISKP
jgi:PAS domain S-box-containing protein